VLLQEPADDRLGDRVSVHVVFPATNLFLYFADAHIAVSIPYRLCVTDHSVDWVSALWTSISTPMDALWTLRHRSVTLTAPTVVMPAA
jgi:hypothetical protein